MMSAVWRYGNAGKSSERWGRSTGVALSDMRGDAAASAFAKMKKRRFPKMGSAVFRETMIGRVVNKAAPESGNGGGVAGHAPRSAGNDGERAEGNRPVRNGRRRKTRSLQTVLIFDGQGNVDGVRSQNVRSADDAACGGDGAKG